jgi:hypothetical protein
MYYMAEQGFTQLRKDIEKGDCKAANRTFTDAAKDLGRAEAHFGSTDSFYRDKLRKRRRALVDNASKAEEALEFYCVLDRPIFSTRTFAGLRRRRSPKRR